MKNVTITMDEGLLTEVRVRAARQGKSMSRYVAEVLERDTREPEREAGEPSEALKAFLAIPKMQLRDEAGRLPSREELYAERDEELFRRRQRSSLRSRPGG